MPDDVLTTTPEWRSQARKAKVKLGLTLRQIGERAGGVDKQTVKNLLDGHVQTSRSVRAVSRALEIAIPRGVELTAEDIEWLELGQQLTETQREAARTLILSILSLTEK